MTNFIFEIEREKNNAIRNRALLLNFSFAEICWFRFAVKVAGTRYDLFLGVKIFICSEDEANARFVR